MEKKEEMEKREENNDQRGTSDGEAMKKAMACLKVALLIPSQSGQMGQARP